MEVNYPIMKVGEKIDLIDLEVRNIFESRKVIKPLIKCCYDFNYYRTRDTEIN